MGLSREFRFAKEAAARKLDPEREIRVARGALETVETASNHSMLADALAENGNWAEAVSHYEAALAKSAGGDYAGSVKLARAYLESGNPARARKILEGIPDSFSEGENDRRRLLLARCLEESGETERALAAYHDVGSRLPGGEAQCRRAALLIASGRTQEAVAELEEVERRRKRLDRYERARHADMYDWAANILVELRGTAL